MSLHKNNFFVFVIAFFLLSPALFSQDPYVRMQSQRINSNFVLVKNEILGLNLSSIKNALENGVNFHIDFTWTFHSKSKFEPSHFFDTSVVLSYNSINHSYIVKEAMFSLPFQTFEKMMHYILYYQRYARLKKNSTGYRCRIVAKGYTLNFFFPINLIYRTLIDSGDFDLKSNWYVMESASKK